jgi:type II secretory pathway pseudopilin PulG
MNLDLSNPVVLIVGGILLLVILFLWNQHNAKRNRERRNRNFRDSYYQRKKELDRD